MLRNHFMILLRNLARNKTSGLLNIAGLAVGVACAGLIFLWVENELDFDRCYPKRDTLYWVRLNLTFDGATRTFDATPALMADALKKDFPGVANSCRIGWTMKPLMSRGEKAVYETGYCVDSTYLSMFGFEFVQGIAKNALKDVHSVIITEKMARQFFGDDPNCIGRTLSMDHQQDYVVTGVVKDMPPNSSLHFDWLAPFGVFVKGKEWMMQYWGANAVRTYVELRPDQDPGVLNKGLKEYIHSKDKGSDGQAFLFSMKDWHLRSDFTGGVQTGGRISVVHLFAVIAWIILIIACINFMNLATARSEKRAREVGLRKVMGAARRGLIAQFLGEAFFMSFLAVILGALVISLVLPSFNTVVEKELEMSLGNPMHLGALVFIILICGLLAGSYPSFYLSSFNPVSTFKGLKVGSRGVSAIRKGLVVFQFTISITLIIGTVIVYQQVEHIKSRELGYDKEHLIDMDLKGAMKPNFEFIRQDLLSTGVIKDAALASNESFFTSDNTTAYRWKGKDPSKDILVSYRGLSPAYFSTMGMQLVEGRAFGPDMRNDSSNVVITQAMERLMGKESAVGKMIWDDGKDVKSYTIVGVIKDYVYGDMYGTPDPVVFFSDTSKARYMYVRYDAQVPPDIALGRIREVLKRDNADYPFEYKFVDEEFNSRFKSEALVGKLSRVFAALAIFISCLGLFGLSSFTAERRTREIGIRKVLGARAADIARMLAQDFLKLVFLSALIAFPVAWWVMERWLHNYAYRIQIQWWIFAASGSAALFIALLTVSAQSFRSAMANPIKSLRTE